jgi:aryl-alcohol dehydrogenase-like predicted oxidoreductase
MATKLPTRQLSKFGPQVTAIGAGLMSLGGAYGPGGSDEERFAYLDKLYEMGETFWENADIDGDAEDLVGKASAALASARRSSSAANSASLTSRRARCPVKATMQRKRSKRVSKGEKYPLGLANSSSEKRPC